jgi:hypothetical protein
MPLPMALVVRLRVTEFTERPTSVVSHNGVLVDVRRVQH